MQGGCSTPRQAVEAFLNDPAREACTILHHEYTTEFFPRLPAKFRQGGRMSAADAWKIEESFRALVFSRLSTLARFAPFEVTEMAESTPAANHENMEIITTDRVMVRSGGGQSFDLTYIRAVVGWRGKYKVAVLAPGD
jgi:hypothetical protein